MSARDYCPELCDDSMCDQRCDRSTGHPGFHTCSSEHAR